MQLTTRGSLSGNRQIKAAVMGLVVLAIIWELAAWIVAGSDKNLFMFGLSLIVFAIVVHILNDWRSGVLLFLVWLLFEDLARKYLGNSLTVYFAKDFLVAMAYFSFYFAKRRKEVDFFRPPFLVPLALFAALGFIQIFNTFSPNILYGLLGLKLYFYYAPLMFLGYAMLNRPEDLDQLLKVSLGAGIVVAGLGIAQSVLGVSFLTPVESENDLYDLSHVIRYSPITHQAAFAPSSVFVSAGRFSFYLILLWILAMGAQGYFLLARKNYAKYGFWGIGIVTVAVMISGTRTPFVFVGGSALVMTAAFLWGAPWRWGQGHRLVKALRRGFLIGGIGLILMFDVFPTAIGGSWAFISETLGSETGKSDLSGRGLGLSSAKPRGGFSRGKLDHRSWHRDVLVGDAIRLPHSGGAGPHPRRRKRFRSSDRGDGHTWPHSLANLVFDPSLAGMENCKEAPRNYLFSIGLRHLVVRRGGSSFVHALDHGALSEFCKQRQLVAPGRGIVPPSSPREDSPGGPHPKTFARRAPLAACSGGKIKFTSHCKNCPASTLLPPALPF